MLRNFEVDRDGVSSKPHHQGGLVAGADAGESNHEEDEEHIHGESNRSVVHLSHWMNGGNGSTNKEGKCIWCGGSGNTDRIVQLIVWGSERAWRAQVVWLIWSDAGGVEREDVQDVR